MADVVQVLSELGAKVLLRRRDLSFDLEFISKQTKLFWLTPVAFCTIKFRKKFKHKI